MALKTMAQNLIGIANATEKFSVVAFFRFDETCEDDKHAIAEINIKGKCTQKALSVCNSYYPKNILGASMNIGGWFDTKQLLPFVHYVDGSFSSIRTQRTVIFAQD